jgi:hypothetical protein
MLDERLLHCRRLFGAADAFDSNDGATIVHYGEGKATVDAHAVQKHCAGTTLAVVATLFGSRKASVVANEVEQADTRISRKLILYGVNYDRHGRSSI